MTSPSISKQARRKEILNLVDVLVLAGWLHGHQPSPSIPPLHTEMDLIIDPGWGRAGQEDGRDVWCVMTIITK